MCLRPSRPCNPSDGSAAITRMLRLCRLRNRPTPIRVPLVPMPAMKCVTSPWVLSRISGPVPSKCARQLKGLLYWSGMKYTPGAASFIRWASRMAPSDPSSAGVKMASAPNALTISRRSSLTFAGMTSLTW